MSIVLHRALLCLPLVLGPICAADAFAQQPSADQLPIAVLQLDKVFKQSKALQDQLAPLKEEAAEVDRSAQIRQTELETVQSQLRKAQPGSPDFAKLQNQLVRLTSELQQYVARERQRLQQKEGEIYLDVYRIVEEEVKKYSKAHGIKLVIRHQEATASENPTTQAALNSLNRSVIFEDGLDITDEIVKAMREREEREERE